MRRGKCPKKENKIVMGEWESEVPFIVCPPVSNGFCVGNLLNRTLGLLRKNCQSTLAVDSDVAAQENPFPEIVEMLVSKAQVHYENLSLSSACEAVLEIGNAGNSYMDERAPWSLFKKGDAAAEAASKDLIIILETMRIIAVALSPIAPSLCWRIYEQLGYSKDQYDAVTWNDTKWGGLKGGQVMAQPKPVFARKRARLKKRLHKTMGKAEGGRPLRQWQNIVSTSRRTF
ncbi:hypothetical protein MLD38_011177 [Melastoma candidum]|uniref:Uncharacterized protein n=1 Tax=Melastoma candidum TaxID=119954 RepID=A0ACB9R283_9MYRT|nr:hypothetical protein MLD38_011177 [Melastoma candidum]